VRRAVRAWTGWRLGNERANSLSDIEMRWKKETIDRRHSSTLVESILDAKTRLCASGKKNEIHAPIKILSSVKSRGREGALAPQRFVRSMARFRWRISEVTTAVFSTVTDQPRSASRRALNPSRLCFCWATKTAQEKPFLRSSGWGGKGHVRRC